MNWFEYKSSSKAEIMNKMRRDLMSSTWSQNSCFNDQTSILSIDYQGWMGWVISWVQDHAHLPFLLPHWLHFIFLLMLELSWLRHAWSSNLLVNKKTWSYPTFFLLMTMHCLSLQLKGQTPIFDPNMVTPPSSFSGRFFFFFFILNTHFKKNLFW